MFRLVFIYFQLTCFTRIIADDCEPFKIKRADLTYDINEIASTINLAYRRQLFNRFDYPRITIEKLKEMIQNDNHKLFLLLSDVDQICGTILLKDSEISLLSVHPNFQGQGLGLTLLRHAEREAFENFTTVFLKVIPLFQENLIRYYEYAGYQFFEREALSQEKLNRIQEIYHDQVFAIIMKKEK